MPSVAFQENASVEQQHGTEETGQPRSRLGSELQFLLGVCERHRAGTKGARPCRHCDDPEPGRPEMVESPMESSSPATSTSTGHVSFQQLISKAEKGSSRKASHPQRHGGEAWYTDAARDSIMKDRKDGPMGGGLIQGSRPRRWRFRRRKRTSTGSISCCRRHRGRDL